MGGDKESWKSVVDSGVALGILLVAVSVDDDVTIRGINDDIALRNGIHRSIGVLNTEESTLEQRQEAVEYLVSNSLPWDTENPEALALRDDMASRMGELMLTDPTAGEEAMILFGQVVQGMALPEDNYVFIPSAVKGLMALLGIGAVATASTDAGQEATSAVVEGVVQSVDNTYTGMMGGFPARKQKSRFLAEH